ncbi:Rha family transcriptional regulator [Vibrio alginolyticus]|nr:Rha family transcriptional regulator [Vibrio alginolyticus]
MTTLTSPIASARIDDLVFLSQTNQLITDSLHVAKYFGKEHKDVLRKLKDLGCTRNFSERNFTLAHYNDEQEKIRPMYQMTKDGFMFLVMGFTGKRAAEIKERYINAFNEMEKQLSKPQFPNLPDLSRVRMVLTLDKGKPENVRVLTDDEFIVDRNRLDHILRDPDIFPIQQLVSAYPSMHERIGAFLRHKVRP